MKYLKLFEAFESEILSKTLSFLSKSGSEKLIGLLRDLTTAADMPLSKLSDEQFQYLPFDKALQLSASFTDEPCDAVSKDPRDSHHVKWSVFGDDGIEGETCQDGRIKRKWGRGTRMVTCPVCGGTGVKPRRNVEVKWVKFWFDREGNFVTVTAVDGIIRKISSVEKIVDPKTNKVYSKTSKTFNASNKNERTTGDKIWVKLGGGKPFVMGTIFKTSEGVFVIQDECDGTKPYTDNSWKKFGRYSWKIVSSGDLVGNGFVLVEASDEVDDKPNPYEWNAEARIRRFGRVPVECIVDSDIDEKLKTASFALVLDWEGIRKGKYETKSDIVKGREETKSGALALMSDEEIKDKNLTRYLNEIAKRLTVDENLKNIKRGAIKILGSNYAGFYAIYTGVGKLSDFMDSIFYVIKESDADYYLTRANNNIQYELSSKNEMNQRILTNTKIIIDRLKSSNSENDKILLSMFEKYQVYLDLVNDYLRNAKMETLRNLEVVKQKLQAIRNMYRNNNSYREIRNVFDNYIDYIARDNTPDRLLNWLRSHGQSAFEEAEVELDDFVETVRELL